MAQTLFHGADAATAQAVCVFTHGRDHAVSAEEAAVFTDILARLTRRQPAFLTL